MSASLKPQPTDLNELQQQQIEANGDFKVSKEAKQKGNKDSSYQLPTHAAHRLHLRLSRKVNDPILKEYTTQSEVVELAPAEYERMVKNGSFAGYDAQDILHDPRPAAVQKASETGDVPTGSPADAAKPLNSLQAAQMRYRELTKKDAPTNKSFEELSAIIGYLESELKADSSAPEGAGEPNTGTPGAPRKPLRSTEDYRERYKELVGVDAPADKGFAELKEAVLHLDSEAGAADLADLKKQLAAR